MVKGGGSSTGWRVGGCRVEGRWRVGVPAEFQQSSSRVPAEFQPAISLAAPGCPWLPLAAPWLPHGCPLVILFVENPNHGERLLRGY